MTRFFLSPINDVAVIIEAYVANWFTCTENKWWHQWLRILLSVWNGKSAFRNRKMLPAQGLVSIWSHMIADDRGSQSQIADDRKGVFFQIIANDRERSQSRLLCTFQSAEVSKLQALCADWKIASRQNGRRRKQNFVASKFISSFSP